MAMTGWTRSKATRGWRRSFTAGRVQALGRIPIAHFRESFANEIFKKILNLCRMYLSPVPIDAYLFHSKALAHPFTVRRHRIGGDFLDKYSSV
jgi:hypothetical protein